MPIFANCWPFGTRGMPKRTRGHAAPAATYSMDEEINRLAALRDGLQRFIGRLPAVDGPEPVPGRW
jgi:hypothetical protein